MAVTRSIGRALKLLGVAAVPVAQTITYRRRTEFPQNRRQQSQAQRRNTMDGEINKNILYINCINLKPRNRLK